MLSCWYAVLVGDAQHSLLFLHSIDSRWKLHDLDLLGSVFVCAAVYTIFMYHS